MARERAGVSNARNGLTALPGAFLTFWNGLVRRRDIPLASMSARVRDKMPAENELQPSNPSPMPAEDLTIAVVICTRDRPRALLETLDSIWSQSRRPDELIIIDDGNLSDRVIDEMAIRCRSLGIKWRYRHTDSPGLTRGRNLAADMAESEVLQYLDDDVTCSPVFLAEIDRLMRDRSVAGVTATVWEPAFLSCIGEVVSVGISLGRLVAGQPAAKAEHSAAGGFAASRRGRAPPGGFPERRWPSGARSSGHSGSMRN